MLRKMVYSYRSINFSFLSVIFILLCKRSSCNYTFFEIYIGSVFDDKITLFSTNCTWTILFDIVSQHVILNNMADEILTCNILEDIFGVWEKFELFVGTIK